MHKRNRYISSCQSYLIIAKSIDDFKVDMVVCCWLASKDTANGYRLEKFLRVLRVLRFGAFYRLSNISLFTATAAPFAFGTSPDGEVGRYCPFPPI